MLQVISYGHGPKNTLPIFEGVAYIRKRELKYSIVKYGRNRVQTCSYVHIKIYSQGTISIEIDVYLGSAVNWRSVNRCKF